MPGQLQPAQHCIQELARFCLCAKQGLTRAAPKTAKFSMAHCSINSIHKLKLDP
jgi:hypothetical protein